VGLVQQDDGAEPVGARGVLEGVLELSYEGGKDAGGGEAAGCGDLLAEVALGETRDLDVADLVAGLGKAGDQGPEHHGLAGAGGGDEGSAHTLVDRVGQGVGGLGLVR
jgi:hypothetical protein